MENIYTIRAFKGIATYEVINHSDDWNTIVAKDTTCKDHENCIVELIKVDNYYIYNKPLNESAKKYHYFHDENRYFKSKELCFIDFINKEIETLNKNIENLDNKITSSKERLLKRNLPVKYLTAENWQFHKDFYTEDYGSFEIIGKIEYADGNIGYLINWKDDYYNEEDYDDRPTILSISNNKLVFKYGFYNNIVDIFYDKKSFENYKENKHCKALKESIEYMSKSKIEIENKIKWLSNIIDNFNETGISYSTMVTMYNNYKKH